MPPRACTTLALGCEDGGGEAKDVALWDHDLEVRFDYGVRHRKKSDLFEDYTLLVIASRDVGSDYCVADRSRTRAGH